MKKSTCILAVLGLLAILSLTMGCATTGAHPDRDTFYGNIVVVAGPLAGSTSQLLMVVNEWTEVQDRERLKRALAVGGQPELLRATNGLDQGYINFPEMMAWRLIFAHWWQTPEGLTKVRLVTDRPILFEEAAFSTRSMDYPFGIVEFTLDDEGKGEGFFITAGKIGFNELGTLTFETLTTEPQKLFNVTMRQK